MKFYRTDIEDVVVFEPRVFGDDRGFVLESFRSSWFEEVGEVPSFVQDNHSRSGCGILRGLHLQTTSPQGKLVRVTNGEIFDVLVDLRLDSPSYGKWVSEVISADNHKVVWVPEGFAHGFLVLSETADVLYKCTNYYDPASEMAILWNDEKLDVQWPLELTGEPLLSEKDSNAHSFLAGMGFEKGQWKAP